MSTDLLQVVSLSDVFFVTVGLTLLLLPLVIRNLPSLEPLQKLPPIILFIYRREGFFFATSPILIIASFAYFLYLILR